MKEATLGPADMMTENSAHPVSEETHSPTIARWCFLGTAAGRASADEGVNLISTFNRPILLRYFLSVELCNDHKGVMTLAAKKKKFVLNTISYFPLAD